MGAFRDACRVEASGLEDLIPFLRFQSHQGRFVLTSKGPLSRHLQETVGDAMVNTADGQVWAVEFKVEESNRYGNLFLETWSNRSRFNLGWLYKLEADVLLYYFQAEGDLYSIPFNRLRKWAFGSTTMPAGQIYRYPEKRQSKYQQLNDTWGRTVPIADILEQVPGVRCYNLRKFDENAA